MGEFEKLVDLWAPAGLLDRILDEGEAGVAETARPFLLAGLATKAAPLLVVVPRSRDAESLVDALRPWIDAALFPAWEVLPGEALSPTHEVDRKSVV